MKIEKGIPIPARHIHTPLIDMVVGDSYFIEGDVDKLRNSAYQAAKRLGIKLTSRKEGKGMRIWRVK